MNLALIQNTVSHFYKVDLTVRSRKAEIVRARFAFIHIAHTREDTKADENMLAETLGMDRTTIYTALKRINDQITPIRGIIPDKAFLEEINHLNAILDNGGNMRKVAKVVSMTEMIRYERSIGSIN